MPRRTTGIPTVLATLLICLDLGAEPTMPVAVAVAAKPTAVSNAGSISSSADRSGCALTGTAIADLDLPLSDADGHPVARFGGVAVPVTVSELPERADGKLRLTTDGSGRVRISGYVTARSIPMYLTQDVEIVNGHIRLLAGTAVEYLGRTVDQIRISVKTTNAIAESYRATVGCAALSLDARKSNKWAPPGHARGYLMKQAVAPLFDKPGAEAKSVSSVHLAPDARGVLFFGDRREGDFVHVTYQRDVGIDAWMSVNDLVILPRGELADQAVSNHPAPADKKLKLKVDGKLYKAQSEIPLYGKADPKSPPIGVVTKDTELYVLDVMVGWANVLPKVLDVVPVGEKHFWVKASELGL